MSTGESIVDKRESGLEKGSWLGVDISSSMGWSEMAEGVDSKSGIGVSYLKAGRTGMLASGYRLRKVSSSAPESKVSELEPFTVHGHCG